MNDCLSMYTVSSRINQQLQEKVRYLLSNIIFTFSDMIRHELFVDNLKKSPERWSISLTTAYSHHFVYLIHPAFLLLYLPLVFTCNKRRTIRLGQLGTWGVGLFRQKSQSPIERTFERKTCPRYWSDPGYTENMHEDLITNALNLNQEQKRAQQRRLHLLHLIAAFLQEQGYVNSVDMLFKEGRLTRNIQVCENVDLESIIIEYMDSYFAKFGKYPKFCRKTDSNATENLVNAVESKKEKSLEKHCKHKNNKIKHESVTIKEKALEKGANIISKDDVNFEMTVVPIFPVENGNGVPAKRVSDEYVDNERILKPIEGLYPSGSEWREIADTISQEIVSTNLNVHWDDVKGLNYSKECLKEAIIYPMKYPSLFKGRFGSSKGILLYGPPGTGKTMLAKAVATECQCRFFNITASSIVSKWRGDSEKYIRVLFDLAYYYAPTIIFIDEIDWIAAKSDNNSSNSEPARRFRSEILGRLDGLLSSDYSQVILLGATNLPWNIDTALLRRLEIRIFIDLPDQLTRLEILKFYIDKRLHDAQDLFELVHETEGYSCADLKMLCKEAWLARLRMHWRFLDNNEIKINELEMDYIPEIFYVSEALKSVMPTVKHTANEYIEWKNNLISK